MLQELREVPTHPEFPDERKFAELGQCRDNSAALLCQLAVTGPVWDRDGAGQVTDNLGYTVQVGNCPGMSRDLFDPYAGPTGVT